MDTTPHTHTQTSCFHCGEDCSSQDITLQEKVFCCEGCKLVYEILNQHDLCTYYDLNSEPGVSQRMRVRPDKFAFLEDDKIQQQLIQFRNEQQTHVCFYIPHIHCSSCLWLLENLHRLDKGVQRVTVNFSKKEAQIIFSHSETSLRTIAELLTSIGYEPYISLQDLQHKKPRVNRSLIYQLGVAGFCFGNIMLLSFPEYFAGDGYIDESLNRLFRHMNLVLALPVFFYSAQVFFKSAWGGLKHGFLNIDVPIVLAVIVTFIRSITEVWNGHAGYFDSMTGIVFFMLAGRILQDKTYQGLSFDRDYTAYFPIAVSVMKDDKEVPTALPDLKTGDTLLIHNSELIPADGIIVRGKALIDYSFVTGESVPVNKSVGEIIYAGGRQLEGNLEMLTIKEVTQSYLTSLWNRDELQHKEERQVSFIHLLSRYFTWVVLLIATVSAAWWAVHEPARIWPAVTAILIIACPCALLLAASFTNGHILRILSRNGLYLRNAQAIENIANTTHIVFDKTGTLTGKTGTEVTYYGITLTPPQEAMIATLAAQSSHPLNKAIVQYCGPASPEAVFDFQHITGKGVCGWIDGVFIKLGSADFTGAHRKNEIDGSVVYVALNEKLTGLFTIRNRYRTGIHGLLQQLATRYPISVLSGDNNREAANLRKLLGHHNTLLFEQQPADKLAYILSLQEEGKKVMMIGDGLNDAGALKQSDIGISITEDSNNFTPASDGILEAGQLPRLTALIALCKANKRIIVASFILSLAYNITGLYFAVQGILSPLVAAILMPASSISIILMTFGLSEWCGKKLHQRELQGMSDKNHISG
ncbi:heavy metal translocating P-type ATPase [Chitinophaga nivalis]|uniref:Heavy metal translocating P-type ATPase metal-binding domain-containing protein n=1 Tax=Chitinophaga nivalis TaxID=2991709 RepID=A0ABT3IV44_9BACT|nr:heavy metal translocating P-type ATPase metal-binding domain-containing protein [Chitinophaga nivalis]MCW3462474.1 heavy metal translocating P-type ATPase metal-binding domain-containing protein [Chitinophaga nivalis]MCW3487835.1 heavy metal translocating P-type ATPase metal-binding domain-containing protein [Chitinophaga nivalis]